MTHMPPCAALIKKIAAEKIKTVRKVMHLTVQYFKTYNS